MTKSLLVGNQKPRVDTGPEWFDLYGDDVIGLCAAVGVNLFPWQESVVRRILGVRPDDKSKFAALESGLLVARQNGKGEVLIALELAGLFILHERLILHSAHEFKTAAEGFIRIKDVFDNSDMLSKRVAKLRTSHGEEGIELKTGERLRFVARSKSSGRGFTGDRILLDEAQELPSRAVDSLFPTLSSRPNPQVIYTGTVPSPEHDSEHWTKVRDRGRKGESEGLSWAEWSPEPVDESMEEIDADDEKNWIDSNPSIGYTGLTIPYIAKERDALSDDGFRRERMSVWSDEMAGSAIDVQKWASLVDPASYIEHTHSMVFSVDVAPDQSMACVAVAGFREDGLTHVEVIKHRGGTGWVVGFAADLSKKYRRPIAIDTIGVGASLIADFKTEGAQVIELQTKDATQGAASFLDDIKNSWVRHLGQQRLDDAVASAKRRDVGTNGAWAWKRKDEAIDITPLVAVTNAARALSVGRIPEVQKKQISTHMYAFN
ncbi:hypothetical protein [Brevibacterium casei]|uniref:hypothetical protein n=1 Tax=Brevibacterium casei TaxID=33889 RepID=UPI00167D52F2|nr:hypothetical protein [Brevibacterium casei]